MSISFIETEEVKEEGQKIATSTSHGGSDGSNTRGTCTNHSDCMGCIRSNREGLMGTTWKDMLPVKEHTMRVGDKIWMEALAPNKRNGVILKILKDFDEVQVKWGDGSCSNLDMDDFDGKYVNETFGYMLE